MFRKFDMDIFCGGVLVEKCHLHPPIHVHPEPQKLTLFGNKVLADIISKDEVILGWGGPNPKIGVPARVETKTGKHTCDGGGRDQSNMSTCQEVPNIVATTRN